MDFKKDCYFLGEVNTFLEDTKPDTGNSIITWDQDYVIRMEPKEQDTIMFFQIFVRSMTEVEALIDRLEKIKEKMEEIAESYED